MWTITKGTIMKNLITLGAALLTAAALSGAASAQALSGADTAQARPDAADGPVSVTYVKPDEFIDMPRSPQDRDQVLKDISAHFRKLGKELPAGQQLKVTVTDLDLAGRLEPRRWAVDDIRIMRGGADWPHMSLDYVLEQDGKVVRSGSDKLSNMMYQQRLNRYFSSDALRYEKQMIDDWFQKSITGAQVSRR